MPSLYAKLFTYRQRPEVSPLENFLTEAFADIFNRLPSEKKASLLAALIPPERETSLRAVIAKADHLELVTQVSAETATSVKRPDMVIYADDELLLAIEAKVHAGFQTHSTVEVLLEEDSTVTRNQLETYAEWVLQQRHCEWPGALVLLTGSTEAPEEFLVKRDGDVITSVRTWRDIGEWILDGVEIRNYDSTYCALSAEFYRFLVEQGLMTKYLTTRDIAAALLFQQSNAALQLTFRDIMKGVSNHAPKLRGSRQLKAEFWSEGNAFWAWFWFARSIKRPRSKPYFAVGICFDAEGEGAFLSEVNRVPRHEPFFFVFCADDWEVEKPSVFLTSMPEGWYEMEEGWSIISTKAIREFSPDPDVRVEELKAWTIDLVDRLTKCVANFDKAPIEKASSEDDEDEN